MDRLPFPRNIYVALVGPIYAFLYFTVRHTFLGLSLRGWLKFFPLLLMVVAWFARWGMGLVLVGLMLEIVIQIAYWRAKRQGYLRFMPFAKQQQPTAAAPVADNERVKVQATGTFSVSDRQAYVLQRPAEYWRVPFGDHAIMVQRDKGSYLYQFVEADSLEKVEAGMLVFGRRPHEALALTFLTGWGPEQNEPNFNQFRQVENDAPKKDRHTIYLTFEDDRTCGRVWHNLLRDARSTAGTQA